jgi:MFS family permease
MLNKRIGRLFLLYLSQGLPFGFQITALPVYLRSQNISLTLIGFSSALALPWMLKALWAPFVDRFSIRKIGRRKTWIIPLQILLLGTILFTATLSPGENPTAILAAVFFMNLIAAGTFFSLLPLLLLPKSEPNRSCVQSM